MREHYYFNSGTIILFISLVISVSLVLENLCDPLRSQITEETSQPSQITEDPSSKSSQNVYLRSPQFLHMQLMCLLNKAPCDMIGRWLKPRVIQDLLGECTFFCHEHSLLPKVVGFIHTNFADEVNFEMKKYLTELGINLQEGESTT